MMKLANVYSLLFSLTLKCIFLLQVAEAGGADLDFGAIYKHIYNEA